MKTMNDSPIQVSKFIGRYKLSPISIAGGSELNFILDVYLNLTNGKYFPQVYKSEFYTLKPSFEKNIFCDEEVFVRDTLEFEGLESDTEEKMLEKVICHLESKFFNSKSNNKT